MDEVWSAMADCGLVTYLHAGGERVFRPPFRSSPKDVATLKRRFPPLQIVAAHLGGFGMWDDAERHLCGTDVFLDLSHTFGWMPTEQIDRIIRLHGASHILFGTDAPWQSPRTVLDAFLQLPLSHDDQESMLSGTARLLFRL